jgi:hypothetical protein
MRSKFIYTARNIIFCAQMLRYAQHDSLIDRKKLIVQL